MDRQNSFGRVRTIWKNLSTPKLLFFAFLAFGLIAMLFSKESQNKPGNQLQASLTAAEKVELGAFPIVIPTMKYGFAIDTFQVFENEILPNQFLADILMSYKVDYLKIEQLVQNAKDVFDVRYLRAGKNFTILTKDTAQAANYFIYEPSVYEYVVFQLDGEQKVEKFKRPITKEISTASGTIESSLWQTMMDNGLSFDLAAKMEDALQWSLDFHRLQKGDKFKLIYEQDFIEGEKVGVGQVYAAYYKNLDNEFHAIYYEETEHEGFYDLEGRPMNKGFLKAPVKAYRISSRYNLRRFHPILKRTRPHYGTDYAAPYGTPILAVGNGVVSRAGYTKGNGNFVKIKHDDTYSTQYLHMQKFASGISVGVHVKQGQVIGYVGSTGLATGPHVCFRFWKNGKQVNHMNLTFPPPEPLPADDLPAFFVVKDKYLKQLLAIPYKALENEAQTNEKLTSISD